MGAGCTLLATSWGARREPAGIANERLEWARKLATGPEAQLLAESGPFFSVIESHESDELLWTGVERIAYAASRVEGDPRGVLVRRLQRLLTVHVPPAPYRHLREVVNSLAVPTSRTKGK